MIDEITKNVHIVLNILANIGILFLIVIIINFTTPYTYFTPRFMQDIPFWIIGYGVGYVVVNYFGIIKDQELR